MTGVQTCALPILPYITKLLVMSENMKYDLKKIGAPDNKIIVHYHGMDVSKFNITRNYEENKKVNFLIISGFEPKKGHFFLLKAFKKAYKKNNKIRLRIWGAGKLENKIKDYIDVKSMNSYVELLGKIKYGSKLHLYEF